MASSSSSSSKYEVFLCFRGETRYSFISHLHKELCRSDINTFIDERLDRGEEIEPAIHQVIEGSRISIVVFSQGFPSSTFCLDEVVKILECKESRQQVVFPVFYKVDPSDVQNHTGNYQVAYSNLITDGKPTKQIDEWKTAMTKVANVSGWHVTNDVSEAEIVGKIVQAVLIRLSGGDYPLFTTEPVGETFQRNVNQTLEWLKNERVSRIGIYGMNGVGKTTLAIVIHNKLLEDRDTYGPVYWISLSRDFDIYSLQSQIADAVRVDIKNEKDVMKRAAKLVIALKTKGRCIVILDGLLKHFSKAAVGIPEEGNKLIVTTHSLKVCDHLRCDKKIKVATLDTKEAWSLFSKEGESLSPEINEIAKSMVQECDGLPLGITKIAQRMRGSKDASEWRNMLKEMKDSLMVNEVFKVLKSSYDVLNDKEKQCIFYCALFPKDFQVCREKLIEYLIVEGIIERMNTRQEEYDKGIALINGLETFCLLEGVEDDDGVRSVKLHNLVRHMVIQLMRTGKNAAMVESGKHLSDIPKSWGQHIVRVSLINNQIEKISPTDPPKCLCLLTLLLHTNNTLKEIQESFFYRMQNLRVLDLSHTGIRKLPASVCSMVNLTALLLNGCKSLADMPSLAKLELLEKLDLSFTKIEEVPSGLKKLSKLRYLNLFSSTLKKVPRGVLSKLLQLQYLRLYCSSQTCKKIMEEVACVHSLETLVCWFQDIEHFKCYVSLFAPRSSRNIRLPGNYSLHVGKHVDTNCSPESLNFVNTNCREVIFEGIDCSNIHIPTSIQKLKLSRGVAGKGLRLTDTADELKSLSISFCKIESLTNLSSKIYTFHSLEKLKLVKLKEFAALFDGSMSFFPQNAFCNLTELGIFSCSRIKKLFYPALVNNLQNLQVLHVSDCGEMEEIIVHVKGSEISLPKLNDLKLVKLPKLENIYGEKIICKSLQQIQLIRCEKLMSIPFFLPSNSLQKLQVCPEKWWESVVWMNHSADYKMQYKPLVHMPKIEKGCMEWQASDSSFI